jgi:hypothetical protein
MNKFIELNQKEIAIVSGGISGEKIKETAANIGAKAYDKAQNVFESFNNPAACRAAGITLTTYAGLRFITRTPHALGLALFTTGCAYVGDVLGLTWFQIKNEQ